MTSPTLGGFAPGPSPIAPAVGVPTSPFGFLLYYYFVNISQVWPLAAFSLLACTNRCRGVETHDGLLQTNQIRK